MYRLEDYLAIPTPLLKSSLEMMEGHSVLLHLHPHSCFMDCLGQPLGMWCGEARGDRVYVHTRGTRHIGALPSGARQLGCCRGALYSWGIRSQDRSQETVEANSPWL